MSQGTAGSEREQHVQGARNAPRMDGIKLARATGLLVARSVKNTGVMKKATGRRRASG